MIPADNHYRPMKTKTIAALCSLVASAVLPSCTAYVDPTPPTTTSETTTTRSATVDPYSGTTTRKTTTTTQY